MRILEYQKQGNYIGIVYIYIQYIIYNTLFTHVIYIVISQPSWPNANIEKNSNLHFLYQWIRILIIRVRPCYKYYSLRLERYCVHCENQNVIMAYSKSFVIKHTINSQGQSRETYLVKMYIFGNFIFSEKHSRVYPFQSYQYIIPREMPTFKIHSNKKVLVFFLKSLENLWVRIVKNRKYNCVHTTRFSRKIFKLK